ncbi:hypothetical protein [Sphingomonas sanxanigenens]|uniref:Uncharacterized protein n=1 Tax=Sphingomonas sanxanigenens DSM 19645 = NX02 TaxID=1123269 RepID=W0AFD2_9SPHN|nr:hypothetical protein [Sphingomonas sanxanigenens]AHE54973.1 hypothetical protein NX02_16470 [Sphingomonas sanxanigenens DSM 19645 = NX02]
MSWSDFFARLLGLSPAPPHEPPSASPAAPPAPPPLPSADPRPPVPFDYEDPRLPDGARPRILTIRTLIAEVEARARTRGIAATDLIDLQQMRDNHLPTLLKSYVEIPAEHRAEIFRKTGHSASFILNEGLDKMATRLRGMSRSLAQGDLDAFAANMRFIEARYGDDFSALD